MKIDRTNYEIWLIDWIDGILNDLQIEELELFLNENPDLRDEFNELGNEKMSPSGKIYPNKELLKKTAKELPDNQFEFFCIAFNEGDLSLSQQSEFSEIIKNDPEKRRIFNLIQKTQLLPLGITYKHKKKLIKRTLQQRIIRLSAMAVSAAAAMVLLLVTFIGNPSELPPIIDKMAQGSGSDTINPSLKIKPDEYLKLFEENKSEIKVEEAIQQLSGVIELEPEKTSSENPSENEQLAEALNMVVSEPVLKKISFNPHVRLKGDFSNSLIALNMQIIYTEKEEGQSNVVRFISKTFREKILKKEIIQDTPLRGYEIAEAGVAGLNKLLGWEMSLNENNDVEGQPRSVYFSSRLLKFNAPVKKSTIPE